MRWRCPYAQIFDSTVHVPSYREWFFRTSYLPAFRFHKQLIQLLQAENGGHWTLKNPWHPLFLDDLTTVYPDARLVMTHRDPAEVVGSACSLIRHVRPMFSDVVDLRAIAEQMIDTSDRMIARQSAFRDKHGENAIYDIQYAAQLRDPIGQMRKLYAHNVSVARKDQGERIRRGNLRARSVRKSTAPSARDFAQRHRSGLVQLAKLGPQEGSCSLHTPFQAVSQTEAGLCQSARRHFQAHDHVRRQNRDIFTQR